MAHTELQQPRHLAEPGEPHQLTRRRRLGRVAAVAGVLLVLLIPVVVVFAATRTTPATDTRAGSVTQPAPEPASAAPQPGLSEQCRQALAAAKRMISHADQVEVNLRGHKKLMDDYKSGKIDRAAALPQDSPWRQALTRTLKDGVAAADQYDADKATYRELAAQCSNGG